MSDPSGTRRRRRRPAAAAPGRPATPVPAPAPAPTVAASTVAAPTATGQAEPTGRSFAALGVPDRLVSSLAAAGIAAPFPIQEATLPDSLAGRDVLGRGQTGSGKTLAFALPLVARLAGGRTGRRQPRGLVLVPTRELADQVLATITPLAAATGLRATTVYGGVGQGPQVAALQRGIDIVVACPGRLEDLVGQRHADLSAVEVTVLDEADHMADLGFLPGVKRLLDRTPPGGQRLLFSATLDRGVDVLVRRYLHDPVERSVDPEVAPVDAMEHHVFAVRAEDKPTVVHQLAAGSGRSVLFMRTKHTAKRLAKQLTQAGIPAVELHGNLSQGARQRNLAAFAEGATRVLVATDIAARGIHVDEVALVVHVDPPTEHKAYLHRSGRTARAGAAGTVVTLALPEQARDVRDLARKAGIRPTTTEVRPGAAVIEELAGPPMPPVAPPPAPAAAPARRGGGRPERGGPSGGAGPTGTAGRRGTGGGRRGRPGSAGHTGAAGGHPGATGGRSGAPRRRPPAGR